MSLLLGGASINALQSMTLLAVGSQDYLGSIASTDMAGPLTHFEASDPAQRRLLSITGGGEIGGGSPANPRAAFAALYPSSAAPASGTLLQDAVERFSLLPGLRRGDLHVQTRTISGTPLPQMNTLSLLPVPAQQVFERMQTVDDWSVWMPRFVMSRGASLGPNQVRQEAKTDGGRGIGIFHYRVDVNSLSIDDGFQISWSITNGSRVKADRKTKGLEINNGSWAFAAVPGQDDQTLMAYQIHIVPESNRFMRAAMGALSGLITGQTMKEFPDVVQAMANRGLDASWRPHQGTNPSGMNYSVRKV